MDSSIQASQALLPNWPGEELERYRQVNVTLAAGGQQVLRMTEGETLVNSSEMVQPIVPLVNLFETWAAEDRCVHPIEI